MKLKRTNKLLAWLLTLVMVCSLLPSVALVAAADGPDDPTPEDALIENIQILPGYSDDVNAENIPGFAFEMKKHEYSVYVVSDDFSSTIFATLKSYEANKYYYALKSDGIAQHSWATGADFTCYPINSARFRVGETAIPTNTFKTGETHTLTLEIGTSQDGTTLEVAERFTFHVSRLPRITGLSAADSDGNALSILPTLDPNETTNKKYTERTFSVFAPTATLSLTLNFDGSAIACYVGDSDTPVASTATGASFDVIPANYMVSGKSYADIPIQLKNSGDGLVSQYHIIALTDASSVPVFTQNLENVQCDKNTGVTLSVAVNAVENAETTYQWYGTKDASLSFSAIDGANTANYTPSTEYASTRTYYCIVTNTLTVDGFTYGVSAKSDTAQVKVNLNFVSAPIITLQPGKKYAKQKGKLQANYNKFEYDVGVPFDPLYLTIIEDNEEGITYNDNSITFYYNSTQSTENSMPLSMNTHKYSGIRKTRSDGLHECSRGYVPSGGLPVGEWYVYAVVTAKAESNPEMTASTVTDFVHFTYTATDVGLSGAGTEESPYLLQTADDFVKLKTQVDNGVSFGDTYFKMTADVTLPTDWTAMGVGRTTVSEAMPFSGILDGDGHTLSYSKGSEPLFNYVRHAVVKNMKLFGEEINGAGLVNGSLHEYNTTAITVDNVTLTTGSSTLKSGLIAGGWTYTYTFNVRNCTVEEGVVIGYTKDQSGIGSFVGGLVGRVEGCTSAATVYGVNNVGGIVGGKANSVGAFVVNNCAFLGKVEASGDRAGGIVGEGYTSESAPNTLAVVIENCYASGTVTGGNYVGGILGAEYGLEQAWDNGIGYIRNNHFVGTVQATAADGVCGGIVGYMRSLNKYTIVENNYYVDSCGAAKGIGQVVHVDTSGVTYGTHDGVFYYDTSKDDLDAIKLVVDGADDPYMSVAKKDHNRTDDPLGADAEKLTKVATPAQMADGTVLNALNQSASSYHNWLQGTAYPVLSSDPIPYKLEITGKYKKEYIIGDTLSTDGMVCSVTWSDGKVETVDAENVTFTGFDNSKQNVSTVTATYGPVSTSFKVTVLKPSTGTASDKITVYFKLMGDHIHDSDTDGQVHTLQNGGLETWLPERAYTISQNSTVWDLVQIAIAGTGITCGNPSGNYIEDMTYNGVTIGEFTNGNKSGWMYTLNGHHPLLGVMEQFLEDGDRIVWHYTDDFTIEEGSEKWNDPAGAGKKNEKTYQITVAATENGTATASATTASEGEKITVTAKPAEGYELDSITVKGEKAGSVEVKDGAFTMPADDVTVTVKFKKAEGKKTTAERPFTDVNEGDWFYDAVYYCFDKGYFKGTSETGFEPQSTMTRAMFATVLWRIAGQPAAKGGKSFSDVEAGQWYSDAVAWASGEGILDGYGGGAFGTNDPVTREQIATMLYRYVKTQGKGFTGLWSFQLDFPDAGDVSDWATEAMSWMVMQGVINGMDGRLNPQGEATRAQVATLVQRLAELMEK